ncbi:hypothetical protein M408DRAFT_7785 [Serendipita vermifera MAFF 305830]|uniref:Uncharacterized protein n=1 Tax=Serendipita vermifera MAFF 305830 TaxID=933852 RepID=A0A0C2XMV4_SERVB|nr:hypothetical protein M408DRAFT_7785 [Serendipita vermifera MAFF 305830]
MAAEFKKTGPFLPHDMTTHAKRQIHQGILRNGMFRLDLIQPGLRDPKKEEAAIAEDDLIFRTKYEAVLIMPNLGGGADPLDPIVLCDMENPQQSVTLPSISECGDAKRYLQLQGLAFYPELWVRHSDRQKFTPKGYLWEHIPNSQSIKGMHVEYINRPRSAGSPCRDYVVVLRFVEKPVNSENAVPLGSYTIVHVFYIRLTFLSWSSLLPDLPPNGEPCCGVNDCKLLLKHLQAVWPTHQVVAAQMVDGPDGVLLKRFDDTLLDPRTNKLIVKVTTCEAKDAVS